MLQINETKKSISDILRSITVRLFADDCIIYRNIINNKVMENVQIDLNRLGGVGG
jgi:hypothetical protein